MDLFDKPLELYDELNNDDNDDITYNDDCGHKNIEKVPVKTNKHNFDRDKRGRLLKGAKIAKKELDVDKIWDLYRLGVPVKDIVKTVKCSKSTVYNIINECKKTGKSSIFDELIFT